MSLSLIIDFYAVVSSVSRSVPAFSVIAFDYVCYECVLGIRYRAFFGDMIILRCGCVAGECNN